MKARTRIVHLIGSLGVGGCETMLLRTLPLISDDEFEQVVITLFQPGDLVGEFEQKGIKTTNIGLKNILDLRSLLKLVHRIRELAPGLVITYLFHADLIGRLYLQRKISAPVTPFLRTTYNFPRYLPARIFERTTKGLVAHYFANSEAVKTYYEQHIGVPMEKISVITNGIDPAIYDDADPKPIIREFNFPPKRFVVTCVANLAENKGHRYLLEAFESFHQSHPEAWLLLIGDGPEKESLRQQIQAYESRKNILFLGVRRDVPNLLAASDAFAMPTLFEGMSNAVLEAMAAGLPVATTDIPENRTIITDQVNGLLVEPAKSQPMQKALETLIADAKLRDRLGGKARRTVDQRFSMPIILQEWRQALRELAKQ